MLEQILIALDQLANTVAGGYADETISARAYRMTHTSKAWHRFHVALDCIVFLLFRQRNHCYISYLSELWRRQLPQEYQLYRSESGFFSSKLKE